MRWLSWLVLGLGLAGAGSSLTACGTDNASPSSGSDGTPTDGHPNGDACANPNEGCPCDVEGATAECGEIKQNVGNYVKCSMGKRTCTGGRWSACNGELLVTKALPSLKWSALATTSSTCASNPCDPYCSAYVDDPTGVDAGTGFEVADGGLRLTGGPSVNGSTCTSMSIAPASTTITVTDFTTPPAAVPFTATFLPNGCATPGTQPTWTVSRPDLAVIDANGNLRVLGSVAGNNLLSVKAYFGSLSASANVTVKVKIIADDTSDVTPNLATTAALINAFYTDATRSTPKNTTTSSTAVWLYPYANTYFPRGLPSPTLQYRITSNTAGSPSKITLRYPSGSNASTALFDFSLFVKESAVIYPGTSDLYDPQIVIPQTAWNAFAQTAKDQNADLVVQRLAGGTSLQVETVQTIHFVDAVLKGTVWYESYASPLGGNNGAILRIDPNATAPTLGIQPRDGSINGTCTVCHSFTNDGTKAFVNGGFPITGNTSGCTDNKDINSSRLYDLTQPYAGPYKPAVLKSYPWTAQSPCENDQNSVGDRFTLGGIRTDGSLVMTHSSRTDAEPRTSPDYSMLWDPMNTASAKSVSGWPTNVEAAFPMFSPDGTKLAFTFLRGNALSQSPSGTLASSTSANVLAIVDFTCGAGCTSGFAVSNARTLTPSVSDRVTYPSFTPDGTAIVYQRHSRTPWATYGTKTQSTSGALSELWMSNIPANKNTAATPTRLSALNGYTTPTGTGIYLPDTPKTYPSTPTLYHKNGTNVPVQLDYCGGGTNVAVTESKLNYYPSFMPQSTGNFNWVIFTSRRMYGNIAYNNPWSGALAGSACYVNPPTKKLWVAAIDKNFTAGTDPSHAAFYLPGQELAAGNSQARWVQSPCGDTGASCDETADCCQSPATQACRIDVGSSPATRSCQPTSSCVPASGECSVDSDCCGAPSVKCLDNICAGGGVAYSTQTFSRDYTAVCPSGTNVVWQTFEWQASIPNATSTISFTAQTASGSGSFGTAVAIGTASSTVTAPSWATGPQTVDAALRAASQRSLARLRVNMTFNTDGTGTATLTNWRQLYDCVPAE